jgi:hypothetical protein
VLEEQTPEWPLCYDEEQAYTTACSLVQEVVRTPDTRILAAVVCKWQIRVGLLTSRWLAGRRAA